MLINLPPEIILHEIIESFDGLDGAIGILRLTCRSLAGALNPPDSLSYAEYLKSLMRTNANIHSELRPYVLSQRSRVLQIALECCSIIHQQERARKASRIFWASCTSVDDWSNVPTPPIFQGCRHETNGKMVLWMVSIYLAACCGDLESLSQYYDTSSIHGEVFLFAAKFRQFHVLLWGVRGMRLRTRLNLEKILTDYGITVPDDHWEKGNINKLKIMLRLAICGESGE